MSDSSTTHALFLYGDINLEDTPVLTGLRAGNHYCLSSHEIPKDDIQWKFQVGILRDRDDLYNGHLFEPHANTLVYYLRDDLSTRDNIDDPMMSIVTRFH